MRPKLRRDTTFIETPEGIYFANEFNTFNVKGKTIYKIFNDLVPYLDGTDRINSYLNSLDHGKRNAALNLIAALRARKVLLERDVNDVILDENIERQFRYQLEFAEHLTTTPRHCFERFRTRRICLVGSGPALVETGLGLLKNGLRELFVAGDDSVLERVDAYAQILRSDGLDCSVISAGFSEEGERSEYDMVISVGGNYSPRRLAELNHRTLVGSGCLLPVYVIFDKAVVGPLVRPQEPGCWLCSMMRWANNASPERSEMFWQALAIDSACGRNPNSGAFTVIGMLATSVVREVFNHFVLPEYSEIAHHVLVQDIETLEASRKRVLPHPLCTACACYAKQSEVGLRTLADQVDLWSTLSSPDFGLLQGYDHEDLIQVPLRHSSVRLSTRGWGGQCLNVNGYSVDSTESAQMEALKAAVKIYAVSVLGAISRINASRAELRNRNLSPIPAEKLWGWLGNSICRDDENCDWMLGHYVSSGADCCVPTMAVDVSNGSEQRCFEPTMGGIGVGLSTEEMINDAVISLIRHRALVDVVHGNVPLFEIDHEALILRPVDRELRFYLETVNALKVSPRFFGCAYPEDGMTAVFVTLSTESSSIPITELSIGAGFNFREALSQALREFIGSYQSQLPSMWSRDPYSEFEMRIMDVEKRAPDFGTDQSSRTTALSLDKLVYVDVTPSDIAQLASFSVCKVLYRLP